MSSNSLNSRQHFINTHPSEYTPSSLLLEQFYIENKPHADPGDSISTQEELQNNPHRILWVQTCYSSLQIAYIGCNTIHSSSSYQSARRTSSSMSSNHGPSSVTTTGGALISDVQFEYFIKYFDFSKVRASISCRSR
jgi:hypothetical protein